MFGDLVDQWISLVARSPGALLTAAAWRLGPIEVATARVLHDSRCPRSLASEMPAMPV